MPRVCYTLLFMIAMIAMMSSIASEEGRIIRDRSEFSAAVVETFAEDFSQIPVGNGGTVGLSQTHFDADTLWQARKGWVKPGVVYCTGSGVAFNGPESYFPAKSVLAWTIPTITVHFKPGVTAVGGAFPGTADQSVPLAIEAIGENPCPLLSITLDCPRAGYTFVGFVSTKPIRMLKKTRLGQASVPARIGRVTAGMSKPKPSTGGG